jgi:formyltetrahydrofolate-dependent phosphoribosylglycinamide formyltransferase
MLATGRLIALRKLGILVGPKGRGSNMAAIAKSCRDGKINAEIAVVIAPVAESPAFASAREMGLPNAVVPYGDDYGPRLLDALSGIDLVCLAGYLRLLPAEVLRAFPKRVMNIHPALLPKFGGKGMYGMKVHEAVVSAQESESGCTVHWVTEAYDEGEIILQLRCNLEPTDSAETVAAKVLLLEHQAYPEAIRRVLDEI